MKALLVALALSLALAVPAPVQAQETEETSGTSTFVVFGYVIPAVAAGLATAVNGTMLAYEESSPQFWRLTGYIAGGVEVAIGTTILIVASDQTGGILLGTIPVVLGVASVVTAFFVKVPDDIVGLTPVPGGGAVLVWAGRF
jgi:hypothetical protein